MDISKPYAKLSNTRGVSLTNLAGMCYVIATSTELSVKQLANEAIARGILSGFDEIQKGERLPTRIHHHMIALRTLSLVDTQKSRSNVIYNLTSTGQIICDALKTYIETSPIQFDDDLRAAWREVLVASDYVRYHWLQHFMGREFFDIDQVVSFGKNIIIQRLPVDQRQGQRHDSGYRITTSLGQTINLDVLQHKEIYQGLRRWTNTVYLTDDRLPDTVAGAFLYQLYDDDIFEIESHIVKQLLYYPRDLGLVEQQINELLDERCTNRIPIPDIMIELCHKYNYSKYNLRNMLEMLYYESTGRYFFERGSEFLIDRAFDTGVSSQDYYLQIEGVWRTGLARY